VIERRPQPISDPLLISPVFRLQELCGGGGGGGKGGEGGEGGGEGIQLQYLRYCRMIY
jgi:hypothetical protein